MCAVSRQLLVPEGSDLRPDVRSECGRLRAVLLHRPGDELEAVEIGFPSTPAHGRTWDHGINVLPLRPGVVVAHADNTAANAQLEAAGIEVIPIGGTALASGRGGPRCLSCPLVRDGT